MPGVEIQPINQSGGGSANSSQSRRRSAWDNDKQRLWKHSESFNNLQDKTAWKEEGGIYNIAANFTTTTTGMPSNRNEEEGKLSRPSTHSSHRSAWEDSKMVVPQKKTLEVGRNGNVRVKSVELHEVDGNEMNESSKSSGMSCLQSFRGLSKVFRSKKFKSYQLETLYQRYFFSLNKSSLFTLLILLIIIVLVILLFHYASRLTTPYKGIFLGMSLIVFLVILFLSTRNSFSQLQLSISCYVVLGNISVIILLDVIDAEPSSATTGVWTTAFFIYMVYTLLPVRMRVAVLFGFLFGIFQIVCGAGRNYTDPFLWKQVRTSVLVERS